jgi:hypothetical protein
VGDGSRINFWHDQWCGGAAPKVTFLVLYGLACVKDASIVVNLEFLSDSNQWNVNFARAAYNWEVDLFASFSKCCI